jgi:glucose-6-phosphate isomerase
MEAAAKADGYKVFNADPTVGGRYSALTAFGLVPSGLVGVDIQELLDQGKAALASLSSDDGSNPGLILGAALARSSNGRELKDKIGLIADDSLPGFGDWIEQLVAESTGKNSLGILPVVLRNSSYETFAELNDMLLVKISSSDHSVLDDGVSIVASLGSQFMLWEFATAVASRLIGINPFDQPDVESAKIAARGMLEQRDAAVAPLFTSDEVEVRATELEVSGNTVADAIKALLANLDDDEGYVSVHAYVDRTSIPEAADLRDLIANKTRRPVTFGWAPRFLHSTGQYHKGGPRQGVYLQIVSHAKNDIEVPGRDFTFGELIASQAAGDAKVLGALGRPVLTLTLAEAKSGIAAIKNAI